MNRISLYILLCILVIFSLQNIAAHAAPPKLSIFHFDVNTGDATLIISPDGHGVLVDAGSSGRGIIPIMEFLETAKQNGSFNSLDYTIATHYDADHIGGMDELFRNGWYPKIAAYDRGNSNLREFERSKLTNCSNIDVDEAEQVTDWGSAPSEHCSPKVTCQIAEYFIEAERGGRRKTLKAGDVIELDHGVRIATLVVSAKDLDGDEVDVFFSGRRKDCADNDLSIGLLLMYGDFRYLIAGDLTGDEDQDVANVEQLIMDDAMDVDVYHVNHHGAETSSSVEFMQSIKPTVAIVSNGYSKVYGHPRKNVINQRILSLDPKPAIYLTNLNTNSDKAWKEDLNAIADIDPSFYDGIIEVSVWKRTYRVARWRNNSRLDNPGRRFFIRVRN